MSSSAAGKFQDHYSILSIDPKADTEIIQRAFQELNERYGPGNTATADPEKLEAVQVAYEVLSDTVLRRSFDRVKGVNQSEGDPKFSGPSFFEAFGRDIVLRLAVLCILYDRRRTRPHTPTLSLRALESTLVATNDELILALWYLKQRSMVVSDDKSSLQITVDGMDFLEKKHPTTDSILPFINPSAILGETTAMPVPVVPPPPIAKAHESVLSVLNRALARA